jgi:hypothetical protein
MICNLSEEIEWLKGHNHITLEAIKNQLTVKHDLLLYLTDKTLYLLRIRMDSLLAKIICIDDL